MHGEGKVADWMRFIDYLEMRSNLADISKSMVEKKRMHSEGEWVEDTEKSSKAQAQGKIQTIFVLPVHIA